MDTQNLILQAIMMTSRYNFDDDCLSNLIESEAALMAGLSADDSEQRRTFHLIHSWPFPAKHSH